MRRFLLILLAALMIFPGTSFGEKGNREDLDSDLHLKNMYVRDLNYYYFNGDIAQTALEVFEDLVKDKGLVFEEGGKTTEFNLKRKRIVPDETGQKHIRMFQYYKGLPVIGGELIFHVDKEDKIYQVNGKYLLPSDISIEPSINANTALQIGLDELYGKPKLNVTKEPSLVIYNSHLTYHFVISHKKTEVRQ